MATERSQLFNTVVIGLLALNLCATGYLIFRTNGAVEVAPVSSTEVGVSEAEASALAEEMVRLYNAKDDAGMYAAFDSIAKAQLTHDELVSQLNTLYPLMGTISDPGFSSAALAGNDAGRDYYTLNYKVRLTGGTFTSGDMKLTVTRREDGLGLVGFFINGTIHTGRQ